MDTLPNGNLWMAWRAAFPPDLDAGAVQTDAGLVYSWRDLDRASAMMANLLASLGTPAGARVLVQVDRSAEAMALYLATLRAGCVFVPLDPASQKAEVASVIADAEPAVVVCTGAHHGWVSKIAFKAGAAYVFTLNDDRTGSLLDRAAHHTDTHTPVPRRTDDVAAMLYISGASGQRQRATLTHGHLLSHTPWLHDDRVCPTVDMRIRDPYFGAFA